MKWAIAILFVAVSPLLLSGAERGRSTAASARAKRATPTIRLVAQAPTAPPTDGRFWDEDSAGKWYSWKSGNWISVAKQPVTPSLTSASLVVGIEAPSVIITYPNDEPLDDSLGIEWYRNGRGRFSD